MLLLISVILIWLDNFTVFHPKNKNDFVFISFRRIPNSIRSLTPPVALWKRMPTANSFWPICFYLVLLRVLFEYRNDLSSIHSAKNKSIHKVEPSVWQLWLQNGAIARTNTAWKRIKMCLFAWPLFYWYLESITSNDAHYYRCLNCI